MKNTSSILPVLPEQMELIDTHCHLDMDAYQSDLDLVLQRATDHGVRRIITIGIDAPSSQKAVRLGEGYPSIYATIGFHPHNASQVTDGALRQLALLAESSSVVAYGEIGLDYVKNYAPRDIQITAFERQVHLARELDLPVIVHDREAHADCLAILRACGPLPKGGVMHCFSGDRQLAEEAIDLGFYLSIPGVVTFNNARMLHEVVRATDLRHLLLETDGPFLAPVPHRGKRNEPKFLLHTARMVAEIKQLSLAEVAQATSANAMHLFQLPQRGVLHD